MMVEIIIYPALLVEAVDAFCQEPSPSFPLPYACGAQEGDENAALLR
jgi:hypothetical protein